MEYMFTNTKQYIGNVTVFYYSYEEQFLRIQDPLLSPHSVNISHFSVLYHQESSCDRQIPMANS